MKRKLSEESNKIEYKLSLPENSSKWLKTIVSFSNTSGGSLIIGVEDDSLNIVGVDESRTVIEGKISDAIFNGVEPTPLVDISYQNYDGKDIIIVKVEKGSSTPYHLKGEDIYKSTYVRFSSTDRVATRSHIEELIMNSKRESFSENVYSNGYSVNELSESDVNDFLRLLNEKSINKEITSSKLLEWGLLKRKFDKIIPTNGYMLLTSNPFSDAYVKVGVFDSQDKSNLLSTEIFDGSIINQLEQVIEYISEKIYIGYNFEKTRKPEYKVPIVVIRELVANAIIHRNYSEKHPIRIEIYNDRITIYSPGSLYDGLQLEDIINGFSKLRNRNISEIFYHLGYIEKWGSGIQRSNQALIDENMKTMEIDTESIHGVNVNVYFEKHYNNQTSKTLDFNEENVIKHYINKVDGFSRRDIENNFGVSEYQARRMLELLVVENMIEKRGAGKLTHYVVIK